MAEAEEKKEPENKKESTQEADAPSMEEILQSIRGVISGDEAAENSEEGGEVLELTEMVEEPAEGEKNVSNTGAAVGGEAAVADAGSDKSILDDIDAALDGDAPKKEGDAPKDDGGAVPAMETPAAAEAAPAIEEKPAEAEPKPEDKPEEKAEAAPEEKPAEEKVEAADVSGADKPAEMSEKVEENSDDDTLEADMVDNAKTEVASSNASKTKTGRLIDDKVAHESSVPLHELMGSLNDKHPNSPYSRGGTSLEDLVIEAMKPFLSEWLNKNLPSIVRKIVEKEVKHILPKEGDE